MDKQLEQVMEWVEHRLASGDVPRFNDVVYYAHADLGFKKLTRKVIVNRLRLNPVYMMSARQQRKPRRSGRHRPIICNSIGNLHADIGFFSVQRGYETPKKYRSGFLVAKDIFTKFVFVHILPFDRTAKTMINAFEDIFKQFRAQYPGRKVTNISFDREKSVSSNLVKQFFESKNVSFHTFEKSASKSKLAEGKLKF